MDLFRYRKWDLVGHRNVWFSLSGITILVGAYFLFAHGINWGIDFTGGGLFEYRSGHAIATSNQDQINVISRSRELIQKAGIEKCEIQCSGSDTILVRTAATGDLNPQSVLILTALQSQYPDIKQINVQTVGPVIGRELKTNALIGVILGCCLILLWIWIRYNISGDGFRYAISAIVALLHDVFILLGMFALLGKRVEANSAFVAALLTVVGYSVNDTVVIFDRIRENLRLRPRDPFDRVVNDSLLQTMARSVNTVLTVEITLLSLFFLGGQTIHSFVTALLIGVTCGAYSSIFNASQLLVAWKSWDSKKSKSFAASNAARASKPESQRAVRSTEPKATPSSSSETTSKMDQSLIHVSETPGSSTRTTGISKKKPAPKKSGKSKRRF